jgi:hypothetical protein
VWIGAPGRPEAGQIGLRSLDTSKSIWPASLNALTPDNYELPKDQPSVPADPIPPSQALAPKASEERPRLARSSCRIEAKVRIAGSETWLDGIVSDISVGGCYMETVSPLAVDLAVELILAKGGVETQNWGVVRHSDVRFGMGIAFTGLNDEQRENVVQIVNSLEREG